MCYTLDAFKQYLHKRIDITRRMTSSTSQPSTSTSIFLSTLFSDRRRRSVLLLLSGLLIALVLFTIVLGTYQISISDVIQIITTHITGGDAEALNKVYDTVVWEIRLPRIIVCIMVGFGLAAAGAVYQGTFRNPLVEPFILGISAGASFGASLGILFPKIVLNVQIGAFLFGLLAVFLVYISSRVEGKNPIVNLILAGVIISSIFQALVSILKYISDDSALRAIVFWTMGGFYYANWRDVLLISPVVLFCVGLMWVLGWKLNILSMGDEEARSLGIKPGPSQIHLHPGLNFDYCFIGFGSGHYCLGGADDAACSPDAAWTRPSLCHPRSSADGRGATF